MAKLLIVDDDEHIRTGLQYLIDWESFGIEIIGNAEGGHEAYRIFEQTAPQIVLTDIRMPDGDGLELIKRIREKGWHTHIIVLSGYDDYAYVRQAMKYQVEDYLLKPVDAGELEEIAKSISQHIERRGMDERIRHESMDLLRQNLFVRWVENRIDEEQLREKLDFLHVNITNVRLLQAAIISWKDVKEDALPATECSLRAFAVCNVVEEWLSQEGRGTAFTTPDHQVIALLFGRHKEAERFAQDNLAWMRNVSSSSADLLKLPWFCAIGKPVDRLHLLHESYRDARRLLDQMEQTGPAQCIDRSAMPSLPADVSAGLSDHQTMVNALLARQRQEWEAALESDFAWAIQQPDPLATAKLAASEWIATIKEASRHLRTEEDRQPFNEQLLSRVFAETSVPAIRRKIADMLEQLDAALRAQTESSKNVLIQEAESYLKKHYHEEVTLQMLADLLHVNSIYLGRLFKSETGEYFSDYLNRLRIEEAKHLLVQTRRKASDIALHCGYSDPNYFFKKFKSLVGLSPTEYRNIHAPGTLSHP